MQTGDSFSSKKHQIFPTLPEPLRGLEEMGRIVAKLRQAVTIFGQGKQSVPGSSPPGEATGRGEPKVKARYSGAGLRALLVALAVILPAILVPATPPETAQIMLLLSIFAGALVLAEYSSAYPGLIEFRFAAPFNRTRFLLLGFSVVVLALLLRHQSHPDMLSSLVQGLAATCGALLDHAFSPVPLLVGALAGDLPAEHLALVRDGAALGLVLGLTTVVGFVTAIRLNVWPMGNGPFNVWINLPTFDPTAGSDVVVRLTRHARINILLGVALPFFIPVLVWMSAILVQPVTLQSPMGFVWGIALWAFLPVSLVMRGVAMARVARMIRESRRRFADSEGNAFAAA